MTFTVTYRGANGAPQAEAVEATNRAECLAKMRTRGVTVLGVKEGKVASAEMRRRGERSSGRGGNGGGKKLFAWVLSVVLVALIAGGIGWWLGRDEVRPSLPPKAPKSSALAKEVKPAAAPKPVPITTNVPPTAEAAPVRRELTTQEKLDRLEQSLTNAYKAAAAKKIRFIPNKRREQRIFTEISDLQIQRLLSTEPGKLILGKVNYDRFEENFRKSLATPITISDDDSDETRLMKEAVIETRKDLERRMKAGEDIAKLMRDTEDELHQLSSYRLNLEFEMRNAHRDGSFSSEDLKDYVAAANEMLKKKGLPELKFPEIWYQNARLRQKQGEDK